VIWSAGGRPCVLALVPAVRVVACAAPAQCWVPTPLPSPQRRRKRDRLRRPRVPRQGGTPAGRPSPDTPCGWVRIPAPLHRQRVPAARRR